MSCNDEKYHMRKRNNDIDDLLQLIEIGVKKEIIGKIGSFTRVCKLICSI